MRAHTALSAPEGVPGRSGWASLPACSFTIPGGMLRLGGGPRSPISGQFLFLSLFLVLLSSEMLHLQCVPAAHLLCLCLGPTETLPHPLSFTEVSVCAADPSVSTELAMWG